MAIDTQPYDLKRVIIKAMEVETRKIIEEEAKNAAITVEKRVREMAGRTAMQASNHYSIMEQQDNLVITVKTN